MTRVFLFDIDGTLMRGTGPYHANALIDAVREVFGAESSLDGIPVHGMLDGDILARMLASCGRNPNEVEDQMQEVMRRAQVLYPQSCPDLSDKVLPGVRETLSAIQDQGLPMALVTGNLTQIGWTKVERAGLLSFFSQGAFADMGRTRAELARIAYDLLGAPERQAVTLVGDSPSDVEAAQANGFRCVALATGMTSYNELAKLGPDLVLSDLSTAESRRLLVHG